METKNGKKITLTRLAGGRERLRSYQVQLDGQTVGTIAEGETIRVTVPDGSHQLRLKMDLAYSNVVTVDEDITTFTYLCRSGASPVMALGDALFRRHQYISLVAEEDRDSLPPERVNENIGLWSRLAFCAGLVPFLVILIVLVKLDVGHLAAAVCATAALVLTNFFVFGRLARRAIRRAK